MSNKVKYGLKNVHYALCTIDASTNTATYGTVKAWPGAVSLSLDAEGGTTKFRADNIDYWVGQSNNGYSGDYESALVPDDFRKEILGEIQPDGHTGILVEDAGAKTKYFALMFQFEGDESAAKHVIYKCSATRPGLNGQTTDEEIEPQTETLTITAGAIHNATLNKDIVKARCASGDDAYSGWFSAVWQPTGSSTTT